MEILTTNFTKVSCISSLKNEDFMELVQHSSTSATALLASVFALVMFLNKSKKANTSYGKVSKRPDSQIQSISLFEFIKALKLNNYGFLPGCGYLFEKYNGAFKFTLGFYKIVCVSRPSIIEKLSQSTNTGHLHKPKEYNKFALKFIRDSLFTLRAEPWKLHRSVLARAFTYNSLQAQVKIFDENAKKLVFLQDQYLLQQGSEIPSCSTLDLEKTISTHVLHIILHIATGQNSVGNHVETERVCYLIEKLKQLSLHRCDRPWLMFDLPWYFHPIKWEMESVVKEIKSMFVKTFDTARKEVRVGDSCEENISRKSLIHLMIKAGFKDEEIFREIFMFTVVSNEGIPSNMKMLLFHLALNPEMQEKCRAEICTMFEKKHSSASGEMNIELLGELKYLEQCILETIRLYPGILATGRFLESPLILDDHTTIVANTHVLTSAFHLHRNPKSYPNPEKFDPDRFSPENVKRRGKCEYIGFSNGPRDCIGRKSAMLEIKVLAMHILYNFEAYTNNSRQKFEAAMGINRWPVPDPKVELRTRN